MTLPNPTRDQMDRPVWLAYMEQRLRPRRRRRKKRTARMEQFFDKNDPFVLRIHEYKHANKMKTLSSFEDLAETIEDTPVVTSLKVDGEMSMLGWDGLEARLVSVEGRVRRNLPVTDEAERILRGKGPSVFIAELYGVDGSGKGLSYSRAVSLLRKPQTEADEKRIRAAVFDTLEYDGKDVSNQDYWKRLTLATNLFGEGAYLHPVYATEDGESTVQKLWDQQVLQEGYEGLVIRTDGTYKLKPVDTIDLAVIGVQLSEKRENWAGALLLAFMDDDGVFRNAGKVGTGLTHKDREEWLQWANTYKVADAGGNILVDPFAGDKVVEVRFEGTYITERPAMVYESGRYESVDDRVSTALGKPSLVRLRTDKHVDPADVHLDQIPQGVQRKAQDEDDLTWTGEEFTLPGEGEGFEADRPVPTVTQPEIEVDWPTIFSDVADSIELAKGDFPGGGVIVHVPIDSPLLQHIEELVNLSLGQASRPSGEPGALFVVYPDKYMDDYEGYAFDAEGVYPGVFHKQLENYGGELFVQYQPVPVEEVDEEGEPSEEEVVIRFRSEERGEPAEEVVPLEEREVDIEIDPDQYQLEWDGINADIEAVEALEVEGDEYVSLFPVIVRISPNSAVGLTEAHNVLRYSRTGPVGQLMTDWGVDETGNNYIYAFIDDTLEDGWQIDHRPPDTMNTEQWLEYISSVSTGTARGTPAQEQQKWVERLRPEVEEEEEEDITEEELSLRERATELFGHTPDVDVALPEGDRATDIPEEYFIAHWAFIDAYTSTQSDPYRFTSVDADDVLKLYNANADIREHMDAVMEELGMGSGKNNLERILSPNLAEEIPEGEDTAKYIEEKLGEKLELMMEDLGRVRPDAGDVNVLLNPNFMKIPAYAEALDLLKLNLELRSDDVTINYEDSPDVNFYEGYRVTTENWALPSDAGPAEAPLTPTAISIYNDTKLAIDELADTSSAVYVYVNPSFQSDFSEILFKLDSDTEPDIYWVEDENVPYEEGLNVGMAVPKEAPEEEAVVPEEEEAVVPKEEEAVVPEGMFTYDEIATQHPEYIDRYRNIYFELFMKGEIEEARYSEDDITAAYNQGIGTQESEEEAEPKLEAYIKETLQAREKVREEELAKFPYEDVLRFLKEDVVNRRPVIVYVSETDYPEVHSGGDYAEQFENLEELDQIALQLDPALGPGDWRYDLVDMVTHLDSEWQLAKEKEDRYRPIDEKRIRTILEKNQRNWDDLQQSEQTAYNIAADIAFKLEPEQAAAYLSDAADGIHWLASILRYDPETGKTVNVDLLMKPQRANDLRKFLDSKIDEIESVWYDVVQEQDVATAEGYRLMAKSYGIDLPHTKFPVGEGPSSESQENSGFSAAKLFLGERPTRPEFWDRYYHIHRAYGDDYKLGWLDAAYKTGYIPKELVDPEVIGGPRAPEPTETLEEEAAPAVEPVTEEEYLGVFQGIEKGLQEALSIPIAEDVTSISVRINPAFVQDEASKSFFINQVGPLQESTGYSINLVPSEDVPRSPGFEVAEPQRPVEDVEEEVEEPEEVPEQVEEEDEEAAEFPPVPGAPPPPKSRMYSADAYERDGRVKGEQMYKWYMDTADKPAAAERMWRDWNSIANFADGEPGRGANLWWMGYLKGFESAFVQQDPRWQSMFADSRSRYPTLNDHWTKAKITEEVQPKAPAKPTREPTPEGRGHGVGQYIFNKYFTQATPPNEVLVDDMFRRRLNQVPVGDRAAFLEGVISVIDPDEDQGWAVRFRELADNVRRADRVEEIKAEVPEDMEHAGRLYAEQVMEEGIGPMPLLDQLTARNFQGRPMQFHQGFWDFFQTSSNPEYQRLGQFLYENLPKGSEIPATNQDEGRMVAEALVAKLEKGQDPEIRPKLLEVYRDYRAKRDDEWMAGFWDVIPSEVRTYIEEEYEKNPDWTYPGPAEKKPYMNKPDASKWSNSDYADFGADRADYARHMGLSAQETAAWISREAQDWSPKAFGALLRGLPEDVRQYLPSESEVALRGLGESLKKWWKKGSKQVVADEPIPQSNPGGLEYMVPYMRGDELAVQYFDRGRGTPSEPVFPFEVGDSGTLQQLQVPIVSEYLEDLALERFDIPDFLTVVNETDPKTIVFVYSESKPESIWENDNTLAINLFRVHNIDDLMIVLIHEFAHVMTILAQEPVSKREDREDATPKEYVEFPEEETAYQEMINFMSFVLRLPSDAIREKLLGLVGEENEDKIDQWILQTLSSKLPDTEEEFFEELIAVTSDFPTR